MVCAEVVVGDAGSVSWVLSGLPHLNHLSKSLLPLTSVSQLCYGSLREDYQVKADVFATADVSATADAAVGSVW